jgi:hypothetical protein
MSPEQRAERESVAETRRKAYTTEKQYKTLEQQYQSQVAQMREIQVDTAIMQPEIKAVVDSYNARRGSPNAFKELVYMVGNQHYYSTGKDIPVELAIKEAQGLIGHVPQQQIVAQAPVMPTKENKPTLPNVQGSNTSVVDKQPRSIADIEEYYNKKFGRK